MALAEFGPSYRRAAGWQAGTAIVCLLSGVTAAILGAGWLWASGAACVGAVVPLTLLAIFPVNHRLLDRERPPEPDEAVELLRSWGRLHLMRSALGGIGFAALVLAALLT